MARATRATISMARPVGMYPSIAGVLSGVANLGPYAVSKVAVVSISETLRIDQSILRICM